MIEVTVFVVLVLHQSEVSVSTENTASGSNTAVEVTGCHMQPVTVLETDLSR